VIDWKPFRHPDIYALAVCISMEIVIVLADSHMVGADLGYCWGRRLRGCGETLRRTHYQYNVNEC